MFFFQECDISELLRASSNSSSSPLSNGKAVGSTGGILASSTTCHISNKRKLVDSETTATRQCSPGESSILGTELKGSGDVKKAKLETKALKAKRPGFTDERYNETSYYSEPENSKYNLAMKPLIHSKPSSLYLYLSLCYDRLPSYPC